jgi:signal peptidase I
MYPTLVDGDMLFVGKLGYLFTEPERGDIVVFLQDEDANYSIFAKIARIYTDVAKKINDNEDENRLVKRVIALEGEQIDLIDGNVYINGELLEESYIDVETWPSAVEFPLVVPEGQVFVMGDNRQYSKDSRAFGCVDIDSIEGHVLFRVYPFNNFGAVD